MVQKRTGVTSKKQKALLLENVHSEAAQILRDAGCIVETHAKALSEDDLIKALDGVSILGIRSKTQVTRRVLESAVQLHTIGAYCIGTNQIDLRTATERGIAVFNAPYSNTRSVVELALGEIIMLLRKTFHKSLSAHKGLWEKSSKECFEIRGKKLGIIGYGNIGSQLSVVAENLGMQVAFFDIQERLALGNARKMKSLKDVLAWADVVTMHVDGRPQNENLIGKAEFAYMKKGSYFLNLSRGHVVRIDALTQALTSGKIAGAAIDVFPHEPKGNDDVFKSPLQNIPNVILTPHVGGSTEEAQHAIGHYVSNKILAYSKTGDTMLSVNFPQVQNPQPLHSKRITHTHANVPGMLAQINDALARRKINVVGQALRTNDTIGYAVVDFEGAIDTQLLDELRAIPQTISVRICM